MSSRRADLPLNLTILKTVESFGEIPRGLLYSKVPASNAVIDEQLSTLEKEGALTLENDRVKIRSSSG